MKVLILSDEEWNDSVYGNGVLTNWFTGFDAEFAQIYCSPGLPYNNICNRYFRITDMQMLKSIFSLKKAGSVIQKPKEDNEIEKAKENVKKRGLYGRLKKLSLYIHAPMMMFRDLIWLLGRYDKQALSTFISDFGPDVVFSPRMVTPKLLRLERIICEIQNAPVVAFTGDYEIKLFKEDLSRNILARYREHYTYNSFLRNIKKGVYKHYLMHSPQQADEYNKRFNIPTSCIYKSGIFPSTYNQKNINHPIKLVYAGRLYCNRWKILAAVGNALDAINGDKVKAELYIYTQEELSKKQKETFNSCNCIQMMGSVVPDELNKIYHQSDIALHVESFDRINRIATKYSFSTKIIDLMASTCAIMAICPSEQTGLRYLSTHDAAICISSYEDIKPALEIICNQDDIIAEYAEKAWSCGDDYHRREIIQSEIKKVFHTVIVN